MDKTSKSPLLIAGGVAVVGNHVVKYYFEE